MNAGSLRSRLILIILMPLLLISLAAGIWQFWATTERAAGIFDRGLLSAALAISRDIAISDGDALSPATRRLVNDTSGGELFYHVYAPDGVFVTGYSTPPVQRDAPQQDVDEPYYYDAFYQGDAVRVLKFPDVTTVSGVSGTYNITVWQSADVRSQFVRDVVWRSFAVISLLVLSVALVVWFGVGFGLRPLLDLERAIAKRTPSELTPIRRAVPIEARSLVDTLNGLLDRISRRISSKDEFISSAAHQLRNPVASILALAEAVHGAKTMSASRERSAELVSAAREASVLTDQLLSFERVSAGSELANREMIDLVALTRGIVDAFQTKLVGRSVTATFHCVDDAIIISGDNVMLKEAVLNLLMNSLVHGGSTLSKIDIELTQFDEIAVLTLLDDGIGIPAEKRLIAMSRFGQVDGGIGSGLGLPIAGRVAANHDGQLEILTSETGAKIRISLPLRGDANKPF